MQLTKLFAAVAVANLTMACVAVQAEQRNEMEEVVVTASLAERSAAFQVMSVSISM